MHPKVKICGMTDAETIQTAIQHKVDYLGFVFYKKSPRNLTIEKAKQLTKNIPTNVKRVAVLVNEGDEFIEQIKNFFDYFQLHGDEDLKRIKEINSGTGVIGEWKLVKSWHVSNARNVEQFIHKKLKEIRTQNNREFFQIDENEAVLKIEEIMKSIGHKEGKYWVITSL